MPGESVFWNMHFRELFHLVYAQYGEMYHLTETEMEIILFLRDDSVYNTARDICKMRRIAKSNVSNGIRMLERKGYIRIQIDEINKKIHRLFLTEKSRSIADVLQQAYDDCMEKVLEGTTSEERDAARTFFRKCDRNVQKEIDRLKSKKTVIE